MRSWYQIFLVVYTRLDTIIECPITNACHAVGNGDGGEAGATLEYFPTNGCHAVGNVDGGEAGAIIECTITNVCHAVGNGDGGQAGAIIESIITNACHAVGNGDGGEAGATIESPISNKNNIARYTIINNGGRDDDVTRIAAALCSDFSGITSCLNEIVDTVNLDFACEGMRQQGQECQEG